jgi:2-phospho-L-lactate guanylyltransferase (CobY/MobA/RfbA family)
VVSPSKSIITNSEKLGATFTYCDLGIGLNKALSEAIEELSLEQPILVIMPDLPFVSKRFLQQLFDKIRNEDILIIPSISSDKGLGTAALYLRQRELLSFQFGIDSCNLFQAEAEKNKLRYRILHFDPYARDLDTVDDVKYLKKHLTMVPVPKRYSIVLDQLDI